MRILWFTWKDRKHPHAGGAEYINESYAQQLVRDGHEVTILTSGFPGSVSEEMIDGYRVIRLGNIFNVYLLAPFYYLKNLRNWPDRIIEEINTIPFLTQFYTSQKRVLLIYQLCREIWFYQLFFPLSLIGYLLEPIYMWLMSGNRVLTESGSTKQDLMKWGYDEKNITVFDISIEMKPIANLLDKKTFTDFTIVSVGNIRAMKRTLDQIKAFEKARETIPELKMKIAGDSTNPYGDKVREYIKHSKYTKDIEYLGSISRKEKEELMKKSHLILVTSVREGWGLIVTEAASQGTPAIVYDVSGLRDSVVADQTGIITSENTPECLAEHIVHLYNDEKRYKMLQKNAIEHSKQYKFEKGYKTFLSTL